MAKGIKGITIELDGNTRPLQKALADVDRKTRDLTAELRQVDRALKFNPESVELLAQKQQLLSEAVEATTTRLDRLKAVQSQVENQFKSGKIGADQWRAFQREVIQTESKLKGLKAQIDKLDDSKAPKNLKNDLDKVEKEAGEAQAAVSELGGALAGIVAGESISGVIEKALDTASLKTKIDIAFEVPEESKKSIKDAIKTVEAYGVDAEEALEGVRRQWALNKNASDQTNTAIIKGAAVIARAYSGLDFKEIVQEVNEIGAALKISNEEALGMVNALLKAGFPPEQIDIIAEYGTQLKAVGYSAEEIQAIFASGVDTKSWNIDNLIDGIKEGRLNLTAFAQEIPKSLTPLLEQANISEKQFKAWGKAIAEGGSGGAQAMNELMEKINGIDDATLKAALGTEIMRTLYEDNGQAILDTITKADASTVDLKKQQDELNASIEKMNNDPAVQWAQAMTDLKTAMAPVLTTITEIVGAIAKWISENPTLAATIFAIVTVIGTLLGLFLLIAPIWAALSSTAAIFGITIGALSGIIGIVIAAIAALIAIGVLLYQNWDTIVAWLSEAWESIKAAAVAVWEGIKSFLSSTWESIKSSAVGIWNGIKSFFAPFWETIKSIFIAAWETIKSFFAATFLSIYYLVTGQFNKIAEVWSKFAEKVKSIISNLWTKVKTTWTTAFNNVKTITSSAINSVVNFFKELPGKIMNWIINLKNRLLSGWNQLKTDAMNAGKNMIQGMIDGIKNMARSLVNKAKEVVGDAVRAAKNLLGISSPSKVFMQIGEDTGEGLEIGLSKKMSAIAKKSAELANAVVFDVPDLNIAAGGSIAAAPQLPPMTINNNFDNISIRRDEDLAELAKLVSQANAREFQRLMKTVSGVKI